MKKSKLLILAAIPFMLASCSGNGEVLDIALRNLENANYTVDRHDYDDVTEEYTNLYKEKLGKDDLVVEAYASAKSSDNENFAYVFVFNQNEYASDVYQSFISGEDSIQINFNYVALDQDTILATSSSTVNEIINLDVNFVEVN